MGLQAVDPPQRELTAWARGFAPYMGTRRAAFMPYWPLGYPSPQQTVDYVQRLVAAGADMLELGIPFSDPLADGPTIQEATQHALAQGMTVARGLHILRTLREEGLRIPVALMTYINPILAYGQERFVKDAAEAGANGLIIPDMPPEEGDELEGLCRSHHLALIYLLAPTSTEERIRLIVRRATGFLYLVSVTGITGAREQLPPDLAEFVHRVREHTSLPLAVGFGIGRPDQARAVARVADGVIVGSALIRAAREGGIEAVEALARSLARAVHTDEEGSTL